MFDIDEPTNQSLFNQQLRQVSASLKDLEWATYRLRDLAMFMPIRHNIKELAQATANMQSLLRNISREQEDEWMAQIEDHHHGMRSEPPGPPPFDWEEQKRGWHEMVNKLRDINKRLPHDGPKRDAALLNALGAQPAGKRRNQKHPVRPGYK